VVVNVFRAKNYDLNPHISILLIKKVRVVGRSALLRSACRKKQTIATQRSNLGSIEQNV
jgi:hypothetical protein